MQEKYGRYECRAENFLGYYSDHIDLNPKSSTNKNLLLKKYLINFFLLIISSTNKI